MKAFLFKVLKILKWAAIIFFSSTILTVIVYRFVNPPVTPLMIIRYFENGEINGHRKLDKQWVDMKDISPNIVLAAVSAEDNNFPTHHGFDFDAITKALKYNGKGKKVHGGSTISQQTAKNVFLWPSRTYIRKGFEMYFTVLIELFWSKERIMEVYLNVIEMGKGIYGIEAASQTYFHKPASKLSKQQAALMTSVFPAPRKRNAARPSGYMYYYQNRVLILMGKIGKVEL